MHLYKDKKGLNCIKTIQTVSKSSARESDGSGFVKLYMLEKEKNRLMAEETKILNRMEVIKDRLRVISDIYANSRGLLESNESSGDKFRSFNDKSNGFSTIQIEY